MAETRTEHDSMGEIEVPADALWGAQTQRAVENFPISGRGFDHRIIRALALVKAASALSNASFGAVAVDASMGDAIAAVASEIAAGAHLDHFPIDVFQTGSGTSTNMNMNEVVARLATQRLGREVHPNDHVNASQSSNDVMPTAMHVAARGAVQELMDALGVLHGSLRRKADEFASVVKAGRTHLMDATPVTLGQEFSGYSDQVASSIERLDSSLEHLHGLALGGTATGTGINAPPEFAPRAIEHLRRSTGFDFTEARDHFAAQSSQDALVEVSGAIRTSAVALFKICNDLRWMGSGPATGLGELQIPDLQPGSSIMPGKVNPVIPEAVCQVVARVIGNDSTVTFAGSQGNFELNVMIPVIGQAVVESAAILAAASALLATKCVDGLVANEARARRNAESTPALATALNPHIGYEAAAEVVKQSLKEGKTITEVVRERGLMPGDKLSEVLDVDKMTGGGLR